MGGSYNVCFGVVVFVYDSESVCSSCGILGTCLLPVVIASPNHQS
jgi:hypothetical protein